MAKKRRREDYGVHWSEGFQWEYDPESGWKVSFDFRNGVAVFYFKKGGDPSQYLYSGLTPDNTPFLIEFHDYITGVTYRLTEEKIEFRFGRGVSFEGRCTVTLPDGSEADFHIHIHSIDDSETPYLSKTYHLFPK